ncbi:MAG: rhomboid family intramembrane serine protease [Halieaceae bacterium]|jgi:GlpG protein|nr:rhomboid family intramembrane serine protease [Halieaceae bacterium]
MSVPATLVLITASLLCFLVIYLGAPIGWLASLTFTPFTLRGGELVFLPGGQQYWRYVTPIFLHFGWLHITFNSLWLWELGALIERRFGSVVFLVLVLLSAIGSNQAQFWHTGPSLFGGMSGVVYALLGFCWVYNAVYPDRSLALPRPVIVMMLVWLVFCMVAPTEMLGIGSIANAAHLGGLLAGCVLAVPLALLMRATARARNR